MISSADTLKSFIEKIRSINLFQRIFHWKKIRNQLIDVASALTSLLDQLQNLQTDKIASESNLSNCRKDLQVINDQKIKLEAAQKRFEEIIIEKDNHIADIIRQLTTANANCDNLESQVKDVRNELTQVKESLRHVQQNLTDARDECLKLKNEEDGRKSEHTNALTTFQKWREQIQLERNRELEDKNQEQLERLRKMKQTWIEHEQNVKNRVKSLCQRHTIEYAEAVPFKGTPDNAIRLANEFIVLDAKSPASDDLNNFSSYLKDQAEKAKKYAKQEGVKKDIFFVVPSNTLDVLKQTVFSLGDYDVYAVSVDVLEPLLLCLQKIETYEFAEQLTPEERENICRIIGRFTHLTKRRIQIDSFFAKQFMEMVLKCDSDLPEEIKKEVAGFEKAEKLNPPSDRRTKSLDNKQLQSDILQLQLQIENEGIVTDDLSEDLNKVRLYRE
jgi:hypothetical protein